MQGSVAHTKQGLLSSETVTTITFLSQLVLSLKPLLPLFTFLIEKVRVMIAAVVEKRAYKRPEKAHSRNCKLRKLSYIITDGVIDILQHQPGGYAFWGLLPTKGLNNKRALRTRIANYLLSTFFNDVFLEILLKASMTKEGRPIEQSQLYHWLLLNVYRGDVQELYRDWLKVKE